MRSAKFDALLSRYYTIIIFLIPALTIFTLFVVLPIGEAAYYSFFRWNGYGAPEKFVGLKNYEFLFKNRVFIMSLKNNFYIIAISLFVQLPFALLIALMISDKLRGAAFFRTVFFLPFILAEIVTALIWAYIYDGNYGLVAAIWGFFGAEAPFILGDKDWALLAILIVIFWKFFGIHMMIYIEGLQAISKEVLEAASTKWNFHKYMPGLVGGHCIGVDPYYLTFKAKEIGYETKLISAGRNINDFMHEYLMDEILFHKSKRKVDYLEENILLLGLSYKANCGDIRNSQLISLVENIMKRDIEITIVDPKVNNQDLINKNFIALDNIPKKGKCLIVSNHPMGPADAVALYHSVSKVRKDAFFFANDIFVYLLGAFDNMMAPVVWDQETQLHTATKKTIERMWTFFSEERIGTILL